MEEKRRRGRPPKKLHELVENSMAEKPEEKKGGSAPKPQTGIRYHDYYDCEAVIVLTTVSLGGFPDLETEKCVFERDASGKILLHNKYWRAIIRDMAKLNNRNLPATIKDHVFTYPTELEHSGKLSELSFPIQSGGTGRGLSIHEVLPIGTEIKAKFRVPRSVFKPNEFHEMLRMAGELIGLSPAKHKMGYGRYTVTKFRELKDNGGPK